MKKRVISLVACLVLIMTSSVFAYRWVESNDDWYVLDESTGEYLKGMLLDTGDNVYYLNQEGKLVIGWWVNQKTGKIYFFSNRDDKDYGGMLFGLHVIDGYTYYFEDDGSLAMTNREGEIKKVYGEYYVDSAGFIYLNNELQRDTSIFKSEFYTNPAYYSEPNLNNYYLANYDSVVLPSTLKLGIRNNLDTSSVIYQNGDMVSVPKRNTASNTAGGTNYEVDEKGRVHMFDPEFETQPAEKYGPMIVG